ncbi:hypothetical protein L6R50_08445 [Myxococcota bacterium]|nr:hypothetical protein [Myxococcota bacterium]
MKQVATQAQQTRPQYTGNDWRRARSILARSFYKELRGSGLTHQQVIELSTELLHLVTGDLKGDSAVP